MARIDDLPADQQAVLRLLLTQERSYDEIARTLRMAPAAVRDRAHEAVATLGPSGGTLKGERRDTITDYLLGQQDDDAAASTRDALEASASERGWARVVSAELKGVATRDLPEVPDPSANGAAASPLLDDADDGLTDGTERSARRSVSRPRASRRGGAILLGVLGLVAALAIGFFVGRATKDDAPKSDGLTAAQQAAARDVVGQANLTAVPDAGADKALGVAQFVERDGQRLINVLAEGLPTAPKGSGYGVWMTGSGQQPVWLGYFQAVTTNGQVGAQSTLKQNPRLYQQVLITRESGRNPKTPGSSYLKGDIQFRSKSG
jgi:hypothetical protein